MRVAVFNLVKINSKFIRNFLQLHDVKLLSILRQPRHHRLRRVIAKAMNVELHEGDFSEMGGRGGLVPIADIKGKQIIKMQKQKTETCPDGKSLIEEAKKERKKGGEEKILQHKMRRELGKPIPSSKKRRQREKKEGEKREAREEKKIEFQFSASLDRNGENFKNRTIQHQTERRLILERFFVKIRFASFAFLEMNLHHGGYVSEFS